MKKESEFPFARSRRVTPEENQKFREAIAEQFGITLRERGRSAKDEEETYQPNTKVLRILGWVSLWL